MPRSLPSRVRAAATKLRPAARRALAVAAALALAALVAWLLVRRDRFGNAPGAAILGGTAANAADYPWYCHFVGTTDMWGSLPKPIKHVACGGALITPSLVLSSMHGLDIKPGASIVIGGKETRKVKVSWRHPFTQVTVIHLAAPSSMRPIKMAPAVPPPGTALTMLGRGIKGSSLVSDAEVVALMADQTLRKAPLTYLSTPQALARLATFGSSDPMLKPDDAFIRAPALLSFASPSGAMPCDGDHGGPIFLPKGAGRAEDLLVAIVAASECPYAASLKTRFTWGYSIPFFNRMSPRAQAIGKHLQTACARQFVPKLAAGTCPREAPWDTGLVNSADTLGLEAVREYARNPCVKTRECAQTARDAYAAFLSPAIPAVRNNV